MEEEHQEGEGQFVKECRSCGRKFRTSVHNEAYCSDECRKKAENLRDRIRRKKAAENRKPKEPIVKVCEICGREFKTLVHNKAYCSDQCHRKAEIVRERRRRKAADLPPDFFVFHEEPPTEEKKKKDFTEADVIIFLNTPDKDKKWSVYNSWPERLKDKFRRLYLEKYGISSSVTTKRGAKISDMAREEAEKENDVFAKIENDVGEEVDGYLSDLESETDE